MSQPKSRLSEIRQIAAELCAFDGLCMDNEPERRKLAAWIAQNFMRRSPEP